MCGIIGFLGDNELDNTVTILLNGLYMLQNRGYDSIGVATIENNELSIIKKSSNNTNDAFTVVKELYKDNNSISKVGIGHTRWATHGEKSDNNAHPHFDNDNKIAIVHNGIIENFNLLKLFLENQGYVFLSQTDTEVIAMLISYYNRTMPIFDAIKSCVNKLSGTWALTIIHKDYPNHMWITRNESPLLLSYNSTFAIVCSEQSGFCNYANQYYSINNNDVIELSFNNGSMNIIHETPINKILYKEYCEISLSPSPYNYWMEKEISEQPECVRKAIGNRINNESNIELLELEEYKTELLEAEHIVFLGCGTSWNAGSWASHIYKKMNIFKSVTSIDGAEFNPCDIPCGKTVYIFLSQSGETRDLIRCFPIINGPSIGVVNVVNSEITRLTTCNVYLNAGPEIAVPSTKSFTNQCVTLTLLLLWYLEHLGKVYDKQIINDLQLLPSHISKVIENQACLDYMAINMAKNVDSVFILGKGPSQAIATECALKLKEVSYIHAEGYSSSALKHGPFALIKNNTPIFIINTREEYHDSNMTAYHETCARNANSIIIGPSGQYYVDTSFFADVIANVYIQLLSYKIAIITDINPDFPRNLAKVVTVA